jgi:hypothetical protein
MLVRTEQPIIDPAWEVLEPTLEEIVLAYLRADASSSHVRSEPGRHRRRTMRNDISVVQ